MPYTILDSQESRERVERAIEGMSAMFAGLDMTVGECLVACESMIQALDKQILGK